MDRENFENGIEQVRMLPSLDDEHGGVIVEMEEPMDPNDFSMILRCSISKWKLQGKKGVWIKLPIELVNLVEAAVKAVHIIQYRGRDKDSSKFYLHEIIGVSVRIYHRQINVAGRIFYHHAEPHYLMLVYWIPETFSTIPANASHRLRIGAIVLNDNRELVVVQEKHGSFRGTGIWKIPTGILEEGEDIFLGARREVKEETGIDTEFVDVLAFSAQVLFREVGFIFLCTLRPLSFDIHKQESEIEAAKWMPIAEYEAQPFAQKHYIYKYAAHLCLAKVDSVYTGFEPLPIASSFNDEFSYLYVNNKDLHL